jgi:hypothetical protein
MFDFEALDISQTTTDVFQNHTDNMSFIASVGDLKQKPYFTEFLSLVRILCMDF